MLALVDGDIVRYRTGFASNDVDERIALWRANETMQIILEAVKATDYRLYLSDTKDNNYRYKLSPSYKSSREKQAKPVHHEAIKQYLMEEWGAMITDGQEADDALGIDQTFYYENGGHYDYGYGDSVICSIDKDLLQVPGHHYNWVKDERKEQNWIEGLRCFYEQCLSGDRTDDVRGLQGIGAVKSKRALEQCKTEQEMFNVVRGMWNDDEGLLLAGRLLWVRRKPEELWEFPSITQGTIQTSLSSNMEAKAAAPSSVLGIQGTNGVREHGSQMDATTPTDLRDLT